MSFLGLFGAKKAPATETKEIMKEISGVASQNLKDAYAVYSEVVDKAKALYASGIVEETANERIARTWDDAKKYKVGEDIDESYQSVQVVTRGFLDAIKLADRMSGDNKALQAALVNLQVDVRTLEKTLTGRFGKALSVLNALDAAKMQEIRERVSALKLRMLTDRLARLRRGGKRKTRKRKANRKRRATRTK